MRCRHCRRRRASRPRGLCWTCYYLPGVKKRYPRLIQLPRIGLESGEFPLPAEPTRARPGTSEKLEVLHRRALLRFQLWHPKDAPLDDE